MARIKERPKFIYQAPTLEYLYCLQNMSRWSEILLSQNNSKNYNEFLKWILEQEYFENDNNISIKKISEASGYTSVKISKWLREIYNDILDLNESDPALFSHEKGIEAELRFRYFDNSCSFQTSLPVLPRVYETFDFFFIKAKLGWDSFWVKEVRHILEENKSSICIFLEGGILNQYREFALSKALFEERISYFDLYQKVDLQIDDILLDRKRYT